MRTRTKVKICGIKNQDEINIINKYPLDYIGFIFAKSKRQITIEQAKKLKENLREDINTVGVFVDEPVNYIKKAIEDCGLNAVQLHSNEADDIIKAKELNQYRKDSGLDFEIFKSISVKDETSLNCVDEFVPLTDYILLDAYSKGQTGGTGKTFNWDMVKDLSKDYNIILAGGLNPDNISRAINVVKPRMVDVNSGVETELIKDDKKIDRLFEKLKEEL